MSASLSDRHGSDIRGNATAVVWNVTRQGEGKIASFGSLESQVGAPRTSDPRRRTAAREPEPGTGFATLFAQV